MKRQTQYIIARPLADGAVKQFSMSAARTGAPLLRRQAGQAPVTEQYPYL